MPRRVYWVRRLVVLVVLAVVAGVGYSVVDALVGAWSRAGERQVATPTSAEAALGSGPSTSSTAASPTPSPMTDQRSRTRKARGALPEPDGVCADSDVLVAPRVPGARLNEPIRIVLEVSTRSTPACTWDVSAESVFLKVLRRAEPEEVVWSSQQCPGLMPTAEVVARQQQAAEVVVSWSGQKSDPECSRTAGWVNAGPFRAVSVARGAVTPLEDDFRVAGAAPQIVVEPSPEPEPTDEPTDEPTEEPTEDR